MSTAREITQVARRILAEEGLEAITLRAIARDMGMTPPSLYHYFDSLDALISHMVSGIYDDVAAHVRAAAGSHRSPGDRLLAAGRAFREWALANSREYELIFGAPIPGFDVYSDDATSLSGRRFGQVFIELFLELWEQSPFPIAPDSEIAPVLREQLEAYRRSHGLDLPLGTLLVVVRCWERLQGGVSLEVFGHFRFIFEDAGPLFEETLMEISQMLGITYRRPGR